MGRKWTDGAECGSEGEGGSRCVWLGKRIAVRLFMFAYLIISFFLEYTNNSLASKHNNRDTSFTPGLWGQTRQLQFLFFS